MVLLIQKLNLSVWHNDPLGRNSFLGEIEIDLASWDWSNKKLNWYPLKPRVSVSQLQSCFLALKWWQKSFLTPLRSLGVVEQNSLNCTREQPLDTLVQFSAWINGLLGSVLVTDL